MQTLEQLRNGHLKGATSLSLSEGLTEFPREIFDLAGTLETLSLSGNKLSSLPNDLGRLARLKVLFCSDNLFTMLPEVLADCPNLEMVGFKANSIDTVPASSLGRNLRWLILTDNNIRQLPAQIGNCLRMQKLMLAGNRLTTLPDKLGGCRNLSLLRISANKLGQLPGWLLAMPRLAWLAFSGNPFSVSTTTAAMPGIDWSSIELQQVLGEGASGIIYKATLGGIKGGKEVAVKVFKGEVTSDGLPADEMSAFMAAGNHGGLPRLAGQITRHPDGKKGVVMELIDSRFYTLGMPPTFDSCTRDVFRHGMALPTAQVLKIAHTVASVACQLHRRGIMHGDLYAHNTLTDGDGNALLSDFGAASFYNREDTAMAHALERLEVSAWGYLLDDLLSVCRDKNGPATVGKLGALRDAAIAPLVAGRPSFEELENELRLMQSTA